MEILKNTSYGMYYKPMEIRLSLLNHARVLKKSSGEVTNSGTINHTTLEPEKGGLFCPKIFKTNYRNNYICTVCSYRQNNPYRCIKCGSNTRLDKSNIHNLSMGHIVLTSPIPHPWFLKSKVIHILCEGIDNIYDHKELTRLIDIDPERVYTLFTHMDLLNVFFNLRNHLVHYTLGTLRNNENSHGYVIPTHHNILPKKIRIITSLIKLKQRPEWMFLKVLPVLSPTYRPLMKVDDKLFIASDINYLYQRVIDRNNNLKKLLHKYHTSGYTKQSKYSPEIVEDLKKDNPVIRAKVLLQKAVIELIDPSFLRDTDKLRNKSIVKRLAGKEGRFRKDILGKRINFSGRTVITSGPRLQVNQCGLPVELALELFKPFLLLKIRDFFINNDYKQTTTNHDIRNTKEVYRLVSEIINRHPILLNRAPTLHRLNIQSFSPLLLNTKAIQLHPLVCSSFNADFDGDTMAVYVPHTIRSQVEARILMMTSVNIISSATYDPIIAPSQDIIFGLYYLTATHEGLSGEGRGYINTREVKLSLENGHLDIHTPIVYTCEQYHVTNVLTTPGRILLYIAITEYVHEIPFITINKLFDKKEITSLIKFLYGRYGIRKTSLLIDQLMSLGFYYAFKAGISLHKNDINIPTLKELFVQKAQGKVSTNSRLYARGIMTSHERSKRLLNEWSKCSTLLISQIYKDITNTIPNHKSSIYMLIHSGARGSMVQMRQLCGIRGLMMKPSGDILEVPIITNFKEGLNLVDYFNSTHGARKGVIDTSLKTAVSGYLTRKLFYASKDIFIVEEDCCTMKGIIFGNYRYSNYGIHTKTFYRDITGRILARDIKNPYTGVTIVHRNELVSEKYISMLKHLSIEYAMVRSPITCESRHGICKQCYGSSADNTCNVSLGESVGIIAAQSIGEPGTQLTMRTFHQGGTVLKGASEQIIHSIGNGRVYIMNSKVISFNNTHTSGILYVNISRIAKLLLIDDTYTITVSYALPYGCRLYHADGSFVNKGDILFDWDHFTVPIVSTNSGIVSLVQENSNTNSGIVQRDRVTGELTTFLHEPVSLYLMYKKWFLSINNRTIEYSIMPQDTLNILNNSVINKGNIIGRIHINQGITQDITGGLSKISKLFECIQTQCSLVSPAEGSIMFNYEPSTSKLVVYVYNVNKKRSRWRLIRVGVLRDDIQLLVRENDYVYKGDVLSDGIMPIRELAEKLGFEASFYNLVEQIQSTYIENGVNIHQKHMEVIVAQMYSKVADMFEDRYITSSKKKQANEDRNVKVKVKLHTVRYPKDYYYSKTISDIVMGLQYKKSRLSIGGISDVTFLSSSFLSSASFQKTSKVLTEASLWRGYDPLMGAQANLFFGYLMPIGTGNMFLSKDPYLKSSYYYF